MEGPEVVTLGEGLLRLSPLAPYVLEQTPSLHVEVAGAEANVAVGLARLGVRAAWISGLPDNPLGRRLAGQLRQHGVDVSRVVWTQEGRVGLYFYEPPRPPRPGLVVYDRAGSAMSHLDADLVDWACLRSARWLHLSGITPALSESCRRLTERAIEEARRAGLTISLDINYRAQLWDPQPAAATLDALAARASTVFCNLEDAATVFAAQGPPGQVVRSLLDRWATPMVVVTAGRDGAVAVSRDGLSLESPALAGEAVDPVGSGDAFAAGFIFGHLTGSVERALEAAITLAALKRTYFGDVAWVTRADLERLLASREGPEVLR